MADNPKWLEVQADLKTAIDALNRAMAAHATAVRDPKADRNAADAQLMASINDAIDAIKDAANKPPGTFPAVTG